MQSSQQPIQSSWFDRWWVVAIVCGVIRLLALIATPDRFEQDTDAYWVLAKSWNETGTFGLVQLDGTPKPTAFRPPLYPWLLSWFAGTETINRLALSIIHLILGVVTCVLGWSITKEFLKDNRSKPESIPWYSRSASWVVGLSIAIDPILVRQSTLIMTETLATMLATLIWWTWIRLHSLNGRFQKKTALVVGVMLGFYCLSRSSGLIWLMLLILLLLVGSDNCHEPQRWSKRIGFAMLLLLGGLLVLSPWAIRNRMVLGKTIWTTSHGGYTLLLANNSILFEHYEKESLSRDWNEGRFHEWWERTLATENDSSELDLDKQANAFAWKAIWEHPVGFVYGCLARFGWFWAWWPSQSNSTSPLIVGTIGIWYGLTTLLFSISAIGSLFQIHRFSDPRWFPAVALTAGLVGVHLVFWSNMRMRAPLIPVVYVVGATFLVRFVNRPRCS
jgi:hypothetical protein